MKALTIKQPFASLIVDGIKDVENRSWPTKYRGGLLIHAAKRPFKDMPDYLTSIKEIRMFKTLDKAFEENLFGCIIGKVNLVDCVKGHKSSWADGGLYNWVLANPVKFPEPIYVKGRLSFWEYKGILAEPKEEDGELFCHCQLPVDEINQVSILFGESRCRYCGGKWYK